MVEFIQTMSPTEAMLEFLADPATHGDDVHRVECIETHISWVFLTDRFASKLKKPVRFDFLDFSTPQRRRAVCHDEVRLNRRLAPDVYLGVVPITTHSGELSLGGKGTPIDWVVKMHRLPADRALDELIRTGQVTATDVSRIGHMLARFYGQLPPLAIRTDEYRREIERHVRDNRRELLDPRHGLNHVSVRRVHEAQLRLLALAPELLDHRALDGRVVEGHGDLRPEHIYLASLPTIIDCVEFNAEFRQIDVLDELAFLAMECASLDAEWIGDEVLEHYCTTNNDHPPAELLPFYKSYRACVRAKVCALRAEQLTGPERQGSLKSARKYLSLADGYRRDSGSPLLVVVRGLTGAGKSTLAAALAESLGIELLQTDAVRRELFGHSDRLAAYGEGIYEPRNRARVYHEMLCQSATLLDNGLSAVLDGTFIHAQNRTDAVTLAHSKHAVPLIVHCSCRDPVAVERLAARLAAGNSLSESRPDIYSLQRDAEEPDPDGLPVCHVDTEDSQHALMETIFARLGGLPHAQRFRHLPSSAATTV